MTNRDGATMHLGPAATADPNRQCGLHSARLACRCGGFKFIRRRSNWVWRSDSSLVGWLGPIARRKGVSAALNNHRNIYAPIATCMTHSQNGQNLMKSYYKFILLILALGMNGCALPLQPAVIADISDSALTVQQNMRTPMEAVVAEAERGCALFSKAATPISTRCINDSCAPRLHLFACTGPLAVRSVPSAPIAASPTPVPPSAQPRQSRSPPPPPTVSEPQPQRSPPRPARTRSTPGAGSDFEVYTFEE